MDIKRLSIPLTISISVHLLLIASFLIYDYFTSEIGILGGGGRGGYVIVSIVENGGGLKGDALDIKSRTRKKKPSTADSANKKMTLPHSASLKKTRTSTTSQGTSSEDTSSSATGTASAGTGGGAGGGEGEGIGPGKGKGDPRLSTIWQKINRSKYYPLIARRNSWEGSPRVSFKINKDGALRSVKLAKSCGVPMLDQAALETVKRSAPLPYYPDAITLVIRFSLSELSR